MAAPAAARYQYRPLPGTEGWNANGAIAARVQAQAKSQRRRLSFLQLLRRTSQKTTGAATSKAQERATAQAAGARS